MARRKGRSLGRAEVIAAAKACVQEEGAEALNVNRLAARLGIRTPSLYNHVTGADDIRRAVSLEIFRELNQAVHASTVNADSAPAFLRAMGTASRTFAQNNVNAYLFLMQTPLSYADGDFGAAWTQANEPLAGVLRGLGIDGEELSHAMYYIQSVITGFIRLELRGSIPQGATESYEWALDRLIQSLEHLHGQPSAPRSSAQADGASPVA